MGEPRFPWGGRTAVMGVLNLTPDSFSDGGRHLRPAAAVRQASLMLAQGADLLDLGAQSTRPGAEEVGPQRELERLLPALSEIRAAHPSALLSIDTFHAAVAEAALAAGAHWINDVSGGRRDPALLRVAASAGCPLVLMHSRGDSRSMDQLAHYEDVVAELRAGLLAATETALAAGVQATQVIWDPGLGFAKDTGHNLALLQGLDLLAAEGFPLLVAPPASASSARCWRSPGRGRGSGALRRCAAMPLPRGPGSCGCTMWARSCRPPVWQTRCALINSSGSRSGLAR